MRYNYTPLFKHGFDWARSRGLHTQDLASQVIKFQQEQGELAEGLEKARPLDIMDGLGDMAVVACVMASQAQHKINKNYPDYDLIVDLQNENANWRISNIEKSNMFEGQSFNRIMLQFNIELGKYFKILNKVFYTNCNYNIGNDIIELFKYFHIMAYSLNLDFTKCFKMALSTIHFRSGEIVDGLFVKKTPTHTVKVSTVCLGLDLDTLINRIQETASNAGVEFFKVEYVLDTHDNVPLYEVVKND